MLTYVPFESLQVECKGQSQHRLLAIAVGGRICCDWWTVLSSILVSPVGQGGVRGKPKNSRMR